MCFDSLSGSLGGDDMARPVQSPLQRFTPFLGTSADRDSGGILSTRENIQITLLGTCDGRQAASHSKRDFPLGVLTIVGIIEISG